MGKIDESTSDLKVGVGDGNSGLLVGASVPSEHEIGVLLARDVARVSREGVDDPLLPRHIGLAVFLPEPRRGLVLQRLVLLDEGRFEGGIVEEDDFIDNEAANFIAADEELKELLHCLELELEGGVGPVVIPRLQNLERSDIVGNY